MIVIINGPLGIGKTSVSWALLKRFERAVMLDRGIPLTGGIKGV